MSTSVQIPPTPSLTSTRPRVPFSRLVRVEVRKLVDTRAGLWLLIGMAVITLGIVVIFLINAPAKDLSFQSFVIACAQPLQYLLPLIAAMAITGEWTQRAGLTTFTLEPNRGRLIMSKVVAAFALCAALLVVVVVVSALANVVGMPIKSGAGSWDVAAAELRPMLVGVVIFASFGIAMGMVTLNTPAAIVASLFGPLTGAIILAIPGLRRTSEWTSLFDAWGRLWESNSVDTWLHLAVAVSLWIVVPLGIGSYRVLHSEVK